MRNRKKIGALCIVLCSMMMFTACSDVVNEIIDELESIDTTIPTSEASETSSTSESVVEETLYSDSDVVNVHSAAAADDTADEIITVTTTETTVETTTATEEVTTTVETTAVETTVEATTTEATTTVATTENVVAETTIIETSSGIVELSSEVVTTAETTVTTAASTTTSTTTSSYNKSFFANSLFIGDSITTGYSLYGYVEERNVFAKIGLNPSSALTKTVSTCYGDINIEQMLDYTNPEIVYIMLGSNGIQWLSCDSMIKSTAQLIQIIKAHCPNAFIVLVSVPPVTAAYDSTQDIDVMAKIREYNMGLWDLADEYILGYINITDLLTDDTGYFIKSYAESDGMHFKADAYKVVLAELQSVTEEYINCYGVLDYDDEEEATEEEATEEAVESDDACQNEDETDDTQADSELESVDE